ncbi:AraC family transcriptional regulator [Yeosuana aromativorans]|uniref:AraC family transcriptional regulator n=1 Tax=Yeosuana aromativorans TaxID=288019 RepID=A0A8J3BMD5_9FLAO|nr:AraC family transcriptional regulator [Yeosuana aromativorans]GGK21592.1 AraC family transcriptional regulator [Yeosuana aromativorans]
MKIFPFKIPKPLHDALVYQVDSVPLFYDKLHQHTEFQISFIVAGEGTLIVGDTINYYKKNDIVVIGSHVPHVFKSTPKTKQESHMLTLFFSQDSFGPDFFKLEELRELTSFFKRATHGFKVTSLKKQITTLFYQLETASKLSRFIILLELLKILSVCNYKSLSSFIYEKKYTEIEGKRMQDVFEYTMTHFEHPISLEHISNVANMTKNAFCKYFKKRTNKPYFRFLNELRIEHACKLLMDKKTIPIANIAYQSGFKNISNFNRQFKIIKGVSPNIFRKTGLQP